ncbi:class I adenylate-forming enzyme family protein [Natrinema halophilum]|uniref:class I adenylate-forming enzyme family protein n=1 Tax=Natrinema halophilum TaxID=1699371 RepID=UPI001F33A5C1|nr:class I adenylate-forming enzyme family protein [Natrinema halophilum]UHQ96114.1 acyl--CoA ligase [Natrinema halophilum]
MVVPDEVRDYRHLKPLVLGEFPKRVVESHPPENLAIRDLTYNVDLTYLEFAERIESLAQTLRDYNVNTDDIIAIYSKNSYKLIESIFAIWKCGAIALPLNWRLNEDTLSNLRQKYDPKLTFVSSRASPIHDRGKPDKFIDMDGTYPELKPFDDDPADISLLSEIDAQPGDEYEIANIFLTGGTTGIPKGVALSHKAIVESITNQIILNKGFHELHNDIRTLSTAPLFHAGALINGLLPTMYLGGTNIIMEEDNPLEDRLKHIDNECVSYVFIVPTVMNRILRNKHLLNKYDISNLHTVFDGGEPHDPEKRREFIELVGCNVTNAAAQTEAGANGGFINYIDYMNDDPKYLNCSAVRTSMRCEVDVVDETGESVPPGERGELLFRGEHMMTEYWQEPDKTSDKIKDGWLYTGDIVRRYSDHRIQYIGRKDDIIITGGENVSAILVEDTIEKHPDVQEAAVFGVDDEEWGEAITSAIVLKNNKELTENDIIQFTKKHLASYQAPKYIWFIDTIDKNAVGKKQRFKVKDRYLDRK